MREPAWVTREECVAIHEMMLAQHGGLAGLRDDGLLQSALSKPQNQLAYGSPTVTEMAASYAAGIVLNHPFIDGNKRTGFMIAAVFLEVNGCAFFASEPAVIKKTLALAAGGLKEAGYAAWLKENSRRR